MMRTALHAEWTKLRTAPGTAWLLLAIVAATAGVSAIAAAAMDCRATGCADPARIGLTGVQLGQAVVAIVAVLTIGGEYGTGMIRVTLTAMPRRTAVLAAKATVLLGVVLAAATVAVLTSLLAARLAGLSLDGEPVSRAAFGSVLYLALIALLSLGVGTAVRNSATAVGVVLGLLYVFPLVAQAAADPDWQRRLEQIGPTTAGLAIQATANLEDLPIGPWEGLGVLALWTAAALVAGTLLLEYRDASITDA